MFISEVEIKEIFERAGFGIINDKTKSNNDCKNDKVIEYLKEKRDNKKYDKEENKKIKKLGEKLLNFFNKF
jgi:hypothetical protein